MILGYPTDTNGFVGLMLTILTVPLGLIIGWFIYGGWCIWWRGVEPGNVVYEYVAPLALATSPQSLKRLMFFPIRG